MIFGLALFALLCILVAVALLALIPLLLKVIVALWLLMLPFWILAKLLGVE